MVRRWLIALGVLLVFAGLLWPRLSELGRLPGDIVIERGGFYFHFPIVTYLLVSDVLSVILSLLNL
jgi:Protein of unknown function (DUF2905)